MAQVYYEYLLRHKLPGFLPVLATGISCKTPGCRRYGPVTPPESSGLASGIGAVKEYIIHKGQHCHCIMTFIHVQMLLIQEYLLWNSKGIVKYERGTHGI